MGNRLRASVGLLLMGALALGLAACSSGRREAAAPPPGPPAPERAPTFDGLPVADAASGSRFADAFAPSDVKELALAMWRALVSPEPQAELGWTNLVTGAAGTVEVRQAYLTNVENVTGGRMWAPTGIDTSRVLEPASGEYVATRPKVNVRMGPSADGLMAEQLIKGTVVTALGREPESDWLLVARRGVVLGYVYAPLLEARAEEGLVLAGGAARRPVLCRDFRQTARLRGNDDAWEGAACRARDGHWRVVDDVLGFTG